jgi:signal transduction histidine kinase
MGRVISNLLDNAVRYNVSGGDVRLATSTVDDQAIVEVTNTGLAIVASIATAHDATVVAHPRPEGGLRVTVAMSSDPSVPCPAEVTGGRPS